jgi:hypothetical protein
MQNYIRPLLFILLVMFLAGCQNLGNNSSYLIKYKKDIKKFYQEYIDEVSDADVRKDRENEANTYLPAIYTSNLPLSVSDHYDTRDPRSARDFRTINQGDPVNIIINKVHLAGNGESLCGDTVCLDTAEIAVVVTVDDGRQEEPKNVLVAYEEGIKNNVDLPMANLLAYATSAYDNQPIRITLTVFEFDQLENENLKRVMATAAGIGATLTPAYAPIWSIASQVGNFLINQNRDDIVVTFTFQVYPRQPSPQKTIVGYLGVPPIHAASYIVLNSNIALDAADVKKSIHLDFGFNAFKIELPQSEAVKPVGTDHKVKSWPDQSEQVRLAVPLKESYAVLTVGKSPSQSTALIIDRLDTLNRKATGLTRLEARSQAGAALLGQDLDDVRSAVTWFFAEGEYANKKTDPRALGELFRIADDPRLNEVDKKKAITLIDHSLPPMSTAFKAANSIITKEQEAELQNKRKWYEVVKVNAQYDVTEGRLMCKDALGKEESCK